MPYRSLAQERFFHAKKDALQKQGVNVSEWDNASKGMNLPEKKAPRRKSVSTLNGK